MNRPTIRRRALLATGSGLAASAALGLPAAATPRSPQAGVNERLTLLFGDYADTAGAWTGAASAYSVPLPDGRTAWLY